MPVPRHPLSAARLPPPVAYDIMWLLGSASCFQNLSQHVTPEGASLDKTEGQGRVVQCREQGSGEGGAQQITGPEVLTDALRPGSVDPVRHHFM